MIKFKNDLEHRAQLKKDQKLEKISDLANMVIATEEIFTEVCEACDIAEDELDSIMYGTVTDMALSDYYRLETYLNDMMKYNPPTKEEETEDEEFIKEINENLSEDDKIDVEETKEAKEVFNEDIKKEISDNYSNAAKEANKELFDTEEDLNSMTIGDLKYFIYKNGWQKEFDLTLINHRQSVLSFLYHKLEDRIAEIVKEKNKEKAKKEFSKSMEAKKPIVINFSDLENLFNKLFS